MPATSPRLPRPLILMPCSGMKLDRAAPASEIYRGVMWQSLRANAQPGPGPHVVVLSALHGFIGPNALIAPYEQRMTPERAEHLQTMAPSFVKSVRWPRASTRVVLAGGGLYRGLMRSMVGILQREGVLARQLDITEVVGGIGEQRSQLGHLVRDPHSLAAPIAGYMSNGTPLVRELGGFSLGDRVRPYYGNGDSRYQPACTVRSLFAMSWGRMAEVELDDERGPDLRQRRPLGRVATRWIGLRSLQRILTADLADLKPQAVT